MSDEAKEEIGLGDKVIQTTSKSTLEGIVLDIRGEKCDIKIQGGIASGVPLETLEIVEKAIIPEVEDEEMEQTQVIDAEEAEETRQEAVHESAPAPEPKSEEALVPDDIKEEIGFGKKVGNAFRSFMGQ